MLNFKKVTDFTGEKVQRYKECGHLMRFCASVNCFEKMNAFADKTQFTDQNL